MADENVQQLPRGLSVFLVIIISAIVGLVVSGAGYFYLFPLIKAKYLSVRVPDVRKMTVENATKKLREFELTINQIESREDAAVPANQIISQDPVPDTLVERGTEVRVIVSKGTDKIAVPSVAGMTLNDARGIIQAAGLRVGAVDMVFDATVPENKVISVSPTPGSMVRRNAVVDLTVSKGEEKKAAVPPAAVKKVTVPNVVGKSITEAKKLIEKAGLRLGRMTKASDENYEFDTVLKQSPAAGASVPEGGKVDVSYNAEDADEME